MRGENNKFKKNHSEKSVEKNSVKDSKKSYEERMGHLEELSMKIREPGIPLEEAMSHFEEGIQLAGELEGELEKTEGKVQKILGNFDPQKDAPEDSGPKTTDFA